MVSEKPQFDVIIIGAGPAGLFFAKELGAKFKVLVLEQNSTVISPKFWVSWKDNIQKNKLQSCVEYKSRYGHFSYFTGEDIRFNDSFCWVLNAKCVVQKWFKEAASVAQINLNEKFLKHTTDAKQVTITTTKGIYTSRMVIDASGYKAVLAKKSGNIEDSLICSNLAGIYSGVKKLKKEAVVFSVQYPSRPRVYFEYFPLSRGRAIVEIFYFSKKQVKERTMQKDLRKHLQILALQNGQPLKLEQTLRGNIGLYKLKNKSLDRELYIGDAGGWPPRATGAGFNAILSYGTKACSQLSALLKADKLSAKQLDSIKFRSALQQKNRKIQSLFGYFVRNASNKQVSRLFSILKNAEPTLVPNFIKHQLSDAQISKTYSAFSKEFSLLEFISTIPGNRRLSSLKEFWALLKSVYKGSRRK